MRKWLLGQMTPSWSNHILITTSIIHTTCTIPGSTSQLLKSSVSRPDGAKVQHDVISGASFYIGVHYLSAFHTIYLRPSPAVTFPFHPPTHPSQERSYFYHALSCSSTSFIIITIIIIIITKKEWRSSYSRVIVLPLQTHYSPSQPADTTITSTSAQQWSNYLLYAGVLTLIEIDMIVEYELIKTGTNCH